MPKTEKGKEIFANMVKTYNGDVEKAKRVFYGAENAGTIKGVTKDGPTKNKKKHAKEKRKA